MFRAKQVFLTLKKAEDLDTILTTIMKDSNLMPAWVLACAETGTTGYEHYHILITCNHTLHMWYPGQFDGVCKTHPNMQALGNKQADEDRVINYMLKQGVIRYQARSAHDEVHVRSRVDYIKYKKQVPLAGIDLQLITSVYTWRPGPGREAHR